MTGAEAFLPAAVALALEAGRQVMALLKAPLVKERKADNSLVTNADRAADEHIKRGLREAFPDHAVLSEETGFDGPADADNVWVVDPLDGTRAYAKGSPGFSVMLGLLQKGKPVLGVVYDPMEDHLYEAARGAGVFHTHKGAKVPARVSERSRPGEWPVVTSTGFPDRLKAGLTPELPGPWLPPINSVGVKVGLLVRGAGDVYVNHHPVHLWDTCGPLAILEEAGGKMTLWDGSPLSYDLKGSLAHPGPTVAASGAAHAGALGALARCKVRP